MFENFLLKISERSREKKYNDLIRLLKVEPTDEILDIGFHNHEYRTVDNYLEKRYPYPGRITALGIEGKEEFQNKYPQIKAIVYDGKNMPFPDKSFTVLHSNAVLEHVGTRTQQEKFLRECARVGKNVFLTMPNQMFPIEIHTHLPLLHIILPKKWFDWVLVHIGKGWAAGSYMNLLSYRDLTQMLDKIGNLRYTIMSNNLLGLPMTYTIVWGERVNGN